MTERAALAAMLQHWMTALNSRGDPDAVAAAVAEEVLVERYGFHYQRGELVEELRGREQVARWMARTAAVVQFELDSAEPRATGAGTWQVRYIVRAPDDFVGGGVWDLQLDGRGQLSYLRHQPDDLAPEHWGPPPEHGDHDHSAD
ncbi:MAG: hypothetical protein HY902_00735 [Deltaproteobacteria bacterium]|nr:hypothetical protein [Deltaproteobacteria bacterium]